MMLSHLTGQDFTINDLDPEKNDLVYGCGRTMMRKGMETVEDRAARLAWMAEMQQEREDRKVAEKPERESRKAVKNQEKPQQLQWQPWQREKEGKRREMQGRSKNGRDEAS
jgi:hypothetical protein